LCLPFHIPTLHPLHTQYLTIDMHSNIHLSIIDPNAKPTDSSCHNPQFKYSPVDHVITIDLNIIENASP